MIKQHTKDEYWAVVRDCLVEIFGISRAKATRQSAALRRKIEQPPSKDYSDLFYHAEPIHIAEDIVGTRQDLSQCRERYDAILAKHNWQT